VYLWDTCVLWQASNRLSCCSITPLTSMCCSCCVCPLQTLECASDTTTHSLNTKAGPSLLPACCRRSSTVTWLVEPWWHQPLPGPPEAAGGAAAAGAAPVCKVRGGLGAYLTIHATGMLLLQLQLPGFHFDERCLEP
jgi:hypothetical protein